MTDVPRTMFNIGEGTETVKKNFEYSNYIYASI